MDKNDISGYQWENAQHTCAHDYLLPAVLRELETLNVSSVNKKLFELGCGNGSVANVFSNNGWDVIGVDPSIDGISHAKKIFPNLKLCEGSAYDELAEIHGIFSVVTSLEVVEHVYHPRKWAATLYSLLEEGGTAIVSTPYHGYWKNLALALTGKMDSHFTALWDHGHIKFWSIKTLGELLKDAGFVSVRFVRVGRIPILAKSMIAIAKKT